MSKRKNHRYTQEFKLEAVKLPYKPGVTVAEVAVDKALLMAYQLRRLQNGCIHHSDRGSHYASNAYQAFLKDHGLVCSMSSRGNCNDNAVAESFFHTLKTELFFGEPLKKCTQVIEDVREYIDVFYNRKRRHSSLDYVSPVQYETMQRAA